jgi:hypothetical protein
VTPRSPLYRAQALKQYARRQQKTILPRAISPRVFAACWILLGLLGLSTLLAWQVQVPLYTTASGALLQSYSTPQGSAGTPEALLFVPATPEPELLTGAALTMQIVLTGEQISGTIAQVLPGIVTPEAAREQYNLAGDLALVITQPSVEVRVELASPLPADAVGDLSLSSQVQVGSESALALFPTLLRGLFGG